MAIDHIIEKFDRPNNFQDEKSTMNNSRITCIANTRKHCATFFASRWMGLLIGPMYGLFLYLYVTHLILSGPPFNKKLLRNDLNESATIIDQPKFEQLLSPEASHLIGLGVGGGTGLALTAYSLFSTEVRCSMVLMVPSLLTKRGRGFMLTFVTSLVIEGPLDTIEQNIQEIVKSLTCMYEHIKTLTERYRHQFLTLMKQMRVLLQQVEDMTNQHKNTIENMMIKATKDQQEQVKEAKADIEMQINKVKDAISEISDVLNAPADLATGLCIGASKIAEGVANFFVNIGNIFGGLQSCIVPDIVGIPDVNVPDIGIDKLKNILKILKPDLDIINFDYDSLVAQIESSSIADIRKQLKAIFKQALNFGKVICTWCSKIFYFTIIFVVHDAIEYQRKHFADDGYDNMLIDDNLKKATKRNRKRKLTPLRKWEAKERYQLATAIKLSKSEVKKIVRESIPTIVTSMIIIAIVLSDFVFANVLQTFQDHAKFGLSFPGMEQGVSFGAMLNDTNAETNILKIEAFDLTTDPCLPIAKITRRSILVAITLILLFCAISCILDAYASRLRSMICNFFHPGRAEERAIYLHK